MIKNKLRALALVIAFILPTLAYAQNKSSFDRGSFTLKGDTLPYRILFPLDFDPAKKYPVVFLLHGAGERGKDNEVQLKYGTNLFLKDSIRVKYAAIVIYPQCPAEGFWSNVKIEIDSATRKDKFISSMICHPLLQ